MKDFPKSKTVIIFFSLIFIIALGIIIPLSLINGNGDNTVTLYKDNFEKYFTLNISYSQVNSYATIDYEITPKSSYYKHSETSSMINLTIAIKFYNKSNYAIKIERIKIQLLKDKEFKINGTKIIDVPEYAKRYESYVDGVAGYIVK